MCLSLYIAHSLPKPTQMVIKPGPPGVRLCWAGPPRPAPSCPIRSAGLLHHGQLPQAAASLPLGLVAWTQEFNLSLLRFTFVFMPLQLFLGSNVRVGYKLGKEKRQPGQAWARHRLRARILRAGRPRSRAPGDPLCPLLRTHALGQFTSPPTRAPGPRTHLHRLPPLPQRPLLARLLLHGGEGQGEALEADQLLEQLDDLLRQVLQRRVWSQRGPSEATQDHCPLRVHPTLAPSAGSMLPQH